MSRPARIAAGLLLAATAAVRGQTPPPVPATPQFRAATDVVMVDVSIRRGGTMVAGLAAEDFAVLDNGIPQRVESVEASAVPIDVTLVVDVSGDPAGPWTKIRSDTATKAARALDEQVRQVSAILRPDDRIRLLTLDTYTQQVFPLTPAAAVAPVTHAETGGMASTYDTLVAALLQPVEPNRRHVVIAGVKCRDTISATDLATVRDVARQSDALLHLVFLEGALQEESQLESFQCAFMGLCRPTRKFWVPFMKRSIPPISDDRPGSPPTLAEAAEVTGGEFHRSGGFTEPTMTGEFRRAFDDFRASYVLRYTPQGVTREGWHEIAVTVPSQPGATIHARKGYAIESRPAPAAPPTWAPDSSRVPRTIGELTAAYEQAEYQAVANGFAQTPDPTKLIHDFVDAGNPWPATPRREAAFALELAEAGLFTHRGTARDEAQKVLDRFARLVRQPLEPDVFERNWLWTELTILEGTIHPLVTAAAVTHALARFPGDPRFVLARAIVTDQMFPFEGAVRTSAQTANGDATAEHIRVLSEQYGAAMDNVDTAAEARIRYGWFLHRIGRDDEALARLDGVIDDQSSDRMLRFYRQLFRGHALDGLGRAEAAIEAFRAALAIWPGAQSARVALMNSLLAHGDRAEAEAMAETIQTAPASSSDPWWVYWQGDYRFYQSAMAALRESIR